MPPPPAGCFRPLLLTLLAFSLFACAPVTPALTPSPSTPSSTLAPSPTPAPLALTVNDESITQEEFDAELARYLQAQADLGLSSTPEEARQVVLDEFIDQLLLAQSAAASGYIVDDALLQARLDALAADIGGTEALLAWQAANGYTEALFRSALRRQVAAAWMRDQVIAAVPLVAEQVHVRQVRLDSAEEARDALALLQSGSAFDDLAAQYDPLTRGELGWFPRGYIFHQSIEDAAFALQPGQYSGIVESSVGFHILYLVERDPAHPLTYDARLTLQQKALSDWLTQRRNESTIEFAP